MRSSYGYTLMSQRIDELQGRAQEGAKEQAEAEPNTQRMSVDDRMEQWRQNMAQAMLQGDEKAQEEYRQQLADRGYRSYEINSETNKADQLALRQMEKEPASTAQPSNQMDDREAKLQAFLAQRQEQYKALSQEHDLTHDPDFGPG